LRSKTSPEPDPDQAYTKRVTTEKHAYIDCKSVHDLPEIFHYWSNRHVRPRLEILGFGSPYELFLRCATKSCDALGPVRFMSIGCGNCDLELLLASDLRDSGYRNFEIDCVDLNSAMLERGRAAAIEKGLDGHLNLILADLNYWTPAQQYDCVVANQALHHVLNLEHLFRNVRDSLTRGGVFVISDMIGRNGHQRWPEALDIVQEFWRQLPPSYRFNHELQRYEELFQNWDCSQSNFEGIRSQDILPLLLSNFSFQLFAAFGNVIDPFIDRGFGPNFSADGSWDRAFIDRINRRDEEEICAGTIKPTHMLAIAGKNPDFPLTFSQPLTPDFCVRAADADESPRQLALSRTFDAGTNPYSWSWPHESDSELKIACRRLVEGEAKVERLYNKVNELERELNERTAWAMGLQVRLDQIREHPVRSVVSAASRKVSRWFK
jgi:SAM-dependent methyltransferase